MADLQVRTDRISAPFVPLFPGVLGSAFDRLPDAVQATHRTADVSRWQGHASVRRGQSFWSRLLSRIFGFPPTGDNVAVEVVKRATARGET